MFYVFSTVFGIGNPESDPWFALSLCLFEEGVELKTQITLLFLDTTLIKFEQFINLEPTTQHTSLEGLAFKKTINGKV